MTTVFDKGDGWGKAFILDTGYSLISLPKEHMEKLLKAFPEAQLQNDGSYTIYCQAASSSTFLSFRFEDLTIKVSYEDFIWHDPWRENRCLLGAFEGGKYLFMRIGLTVPHI